MSREADPAPDGSTMMGPVACAGIVGTNVWIGTVLGVTEIDGAASACCDGGRGGGAILGGALSPLLGTIGISVPFTGT
jgi:hypothetical protein